MMFSCWIKKLFDSIDFPAFEIENLAKFLNELDALVGLTSSNHWILFTFFYFKFILFFWAPFPNLFLTVLISNCSSDV